MSRQPHQLHIVTFKIWRADVFYIQQGTGLSVKEGELVIVEADRGQDLGTVAHANVTWAEAKMLKEKYAQHHYDQLMIFSRHNQEVGADDSGARGMMAVNGGRGSAVGGMGPPGAQQGAQEPSAGELKPKMIRRLAQPHEIQLLKEKEGNEAKAKRLCQQKVVEHRLNMEILDAEFQLCELQSGEVASLQANMAFQGLEEVNLLLLRRRIHQLQLSCHRSLQDV